MQRRRTRVGLGVGAESEHFQAGFFFVAEHQSETVDGDGPVDAVDAGAQDVVQFQAQFLVAADERGQGVEVVEGQVGETGGQELHEQAGFGLKEPDERAGEAAKDPDDPDPP